MGIFEKAIPKYTYNMANEVVVEPQDVYVNDIFDPILNARVKEAMRQKYGDGLYGVVGGYEELWKNTFTGNKGILGPGMGILSTFGSSMNKADDIILGALTEGIKAMSFQGATNPLENIFVNDYDYTGKGLLAATANVGRGLVGTTVDESDFGTAWTLPSLGIELATDVGILGGGIARKLAPEASKLTSKELFKNLGKSDLKTTVGEIGQLMSNYDDLMAKVSIGIAAPGLRPALKGLKNKIAELVAHHAHHPYADATVRTAGGKSSNALLLELIRMFKNVDDVEKGIPVSEDELVQAAARTQSEIVDDTVANTASNVLNKELNSSNAQPAPEFVADPYASWTESLSNFERTKNEMFEKSISEMQNAHIPIEQVGIDRRLGLVTEDLDEIRQILNDNFFKEYGFTKPEQFAHNLKADPEYPEDVFQRLKDFLTYLNKNDKVAYDTDPAVQPWKEVYEEAKKYNDEQRARFLESLANNGIFSEVLDGKRSPELGYAKLFDFLEHYYDNPTNIPRADFRVTRSISDGKVTYKPIWTEDFDPAKRYPWLPSEHALLTQPISLNRAYADDVMDKLSDDEKLLEALESGVWSENESVSNLINAILSDPKYKDKLWYPSFNANFTISPSLYSKLEIDGVPNAIATSYALVDRARYVDGDLARPRFTTEEEFDKYMDSDEMTTAINGMFPPSEVDSFTKSRYAVEDPEALNTDWQAVRVKAFKKRLKAVMFPKEGSDIESAYKALQELSNYFDEHSGVVNGTWAYAVPEQFSFLQDLSKHVDEVGSRFIDPLEGYGVTSRDTRRLRALDERMGRTNGIENSQKMNIDDYVKAIFNTAARHITDMDTLRKIYEPLAPYYQIKLKKDHTLKLANGTSTHDAVTRFVNDVFPLAEEYSRKGGQIYTLKGDKTYYPKYMKKERVDALKNYLGWGAAPDENATEFLNLTNEVFKNSKYAPRADIPDQVLGPILDSLRKEGLLEIKDGKFTPDTVKLVRERLADEGSDFGFKPKRDVSKYMEPIIIHEGDTSVISQITADTLPRELISRVRTPDEMLAVLNTDAAMPFRRSVGNSNTSGQAFDYGFAEYERVVEELNASLKDLGFASQKELQDLIAKAKSLGKDNLHKLPIDEYRKLNAYSIAYYNAVKRIPYHSVTRNILDFKPNAGFNGIYKALDGLTKPEGMSDAAFASVKKRLINLLNEELLTHLSKQTVNPLKALAAPWDDYIYPSTQRINRFGIHKSDPLETDFFKEIEDALYTGDLSKIDKIRKKYYAKARHSNHSTAFLKDFTDRLGWTARTAPSEFAYTPGNVSFVEENFINHLPDKYKTAWRPSARNGLFYFDMHEGELPDLIRISENFDVHPETFQLMERTGKNFEELLLSDYFYKPSSAGAKHYTPYLGYIDYTRLTPEGIADMSRKLSNRDIRMEYFKQHASPAKFGTAEDLLVKITSEDSTVQEVVENVSESIVKAEPEIVSKLAYEAPDLSEAVFDDVLKEVVGEDAYRFYKESGGDDDAFRRVFGERAWNLKEQIARATAVPSENSFRTKRATLRTNVAKNLLTRVHSFVTRYRLGGGNAADFRRFVILRQQPYGDVVEGKNFWDEFRRAGMFEATYAKGSDRATTVLDSLTTNAKLINEAAKHDIVRVYANEVANDKVHIYMQFVDDIKGVDRINKAADKIEKLNFETVMFSPPKAYSAEDLAFMNTPAMRELSGLMDEAEAIAKDQLSWLGFKIDNAAPYTKHAMLRTPDTASFFNDNFYKEFPSESLDEFVNSISNLDRYRKLDRGSFGTVLNTRRFRGDTWMLDEPNAYRFNYNPYEMVTSTLADGAFANLQFQSYVDLLINDNFKIKGIFNTVDELKEVLYKPLENGKQSGNLRNLDLCTVKRNSDGKIIGLTKYDKLSDAGLAKALADENTILVPTNAVSHLDNLLKKDIRMSNKFWVFFNKNFTIPFKFGVLSNPGFLLGNMSDSYLKIATTMAQKYGTTVPDEAKRVAACMKHAKAFKEEFYNAFDIWRKVSAENYIALSPEATVPDIVAMHPKYNEQFMDWLSDRLVTTVRVKDVTGEWQTIEFAVPCNLPERTKNAASLWVTLQTMQMNSNKLREFADIADLYSTSKYDMPTNLWDRITQGKGKYDAKRPSTWGLFMNNPLMRAMLNKSSGWEDVIRTASILDDLEHGYTFEELGAFARSAKYTANDMEFRVRLDEAKNAMYNAQFDYERGSDFMEGVGKVVPFPVFFLKNFAYWMELFAQNPQYVDNAIDIQEGLWSGRDKEEASDSFAAEAKGRGAIPVGGDALPNWFKGFYKPSPLQSMFGAFSLLNNPVDDMRYRVNPLISGGVAAVANEFPNELTTYLAKDTETKYRPYSTDMYERNVTSSDPNFNPLEYAVHRANPYERAVSTYLRTPQKIREGEAQLSDFVPSVFQPDF